MSVVSILGLAALASPAHADCPANTLAIRSQVETSLQAFEDWEWERFVDTAGLVRNDLACLSEVLSATDSLQIHHLHVLLAAQQQDEALARATLRAALRIDGNYKPSADLIAPGSMLRKAFDEVDAAEAAKGTELPAGTWFVDGTPGATFLPGESTALVQTVDQATGLRTWYLLGQELPEDLTELIAGDDLVDEQALSEPPPAVPVSEVAPVALTDSPPPVVEFGRRVSPGLLVTGLLAGAAAAGGVAWANHLDQKLQETDNQRTARETYELGLGVTIGSYSLSGVAGGLVLGALIGRRQHE